MTLNRILHMYRNEPPLYWPFASLFCLGLGWVACQHGTLGMSGILGRSIVLLLIIHLADAVVKGSVFVARNFRFSVELRPEE